MQSVQYLYVAYMHFEIRVLSGHSTRAVQLQQYVCVYVYALMCLWPALSAGAVPAGPVCLRLHEHQPSQHHVHTK